MIRITALFVAATLVLAGCASLPHAEPVQVTVASIDSLPGEGLEVRMLVKLRVQNPNDASIDYNGVSVTLDVLNKPFATGVSSERGTVPRFGEAVIDVPVTISVLRMATQVMGLLGGEPMDKITYELHGRLNGSTFGSVPFKSHGELTLPTSAPEATDVVHQ